MTRNEPILPGSHMAVIRVNPIVQNRMILLYLPPRSYNPGSSISGSKCTRHTFFVFHIVYSDLAGANQSVVLFIDERKIIMCAWLGFLLRQCPSDKCLGICFCIWAKRHEFYHFRVGAILMDSWKIFLHGYPLKSAFPFPVLYRHCFSILSSHIISSFQPSILCLFYLR